MPNTFSMTISGVLKDGTNPVEILKGFEEHTKDLFTSPQDFVFEDKLTVNKVHFQVEMAEGTPHSHCTAYVRTDKDYKEDSTKIST
jgi:hypothetical protein